MRKLFPQKELLVTVSKRAVFAKEIIVRRINDI
jgi:hypothetical protein